MSSDSATVRLIKRVAEDEDLHQALRDAPTRDEKHQVVRDAGLEIPSYDDVLADVSAGSSSVADTVIDAAVMVSIVASVCAE